MPHHDLVIIGSGSGNSLLTPELAGLDVAIIEAGTFGGTCLNVGCIPTKMFVGPADRVLDATDAHRLGIGDRLRLFAAVCEAVRYAHQNLIVHRDLKPANILVTADGTVKLLDFGIAKLLDTNPDGTEADTRTELRVLTPEYAAPEQIRGDPITTATDVYALGAVLYELLAGRRAHRFERPTPAEIEAFRKMAESRAA